MRITKINNALPKLQRPLQPIKQKKEDLLQKCSEVKHKRIKDLSTKEIPFLAALIGLFSPIPFGFLIGYGLGKLVEWSVNAFKKK